MKPLLRPTLRLLPLSLAAAFAVLPAQAQSLLDLYEAARGHDAAFQSARATFEAAQHRAEQARAGLLPTANLTSSRSETQQDQRTTSSTQRNFGTGSASVSVSQPLYRPANRATRRSGNTCDKVRQRTAPPPRRRCRRGFPE